MAAAVRVIRRGRARGRCCFDIGKTAIRTAARTLLPESLSFRENGLVAMRRKFRIGHKPGVIGLKAIESLKPMTFQGQEIIPDPCNEQESFSGQRLFQFLPAILTMVPGSVLLFILFKGWPFGIQIASSIVYSSAAFFFTFAGRGLRPYLLDCPVVQHHWDRLIMRHFGFLIALFIVVTTALKIRPRLSLWWIVAQGRDMSPFDLTMFILCGSVLLTEVITNRSVLRRAHLERATSDD